MANFFIYAIDFRVFIGQCVMNRILSCFSHSCFSRIINPIKPDRQIILEVQLLSQGFTQAEQMAMKLTMFLDLCGVLLSTVPSSGR